jgi:hypothetical protein
MLPVPGATWRRHSFVETMAKNVCGSLKMMIAMTAPSFRLKSLLIGGFTVNVTIIPLRQSQRC